jgi:hypothetical protein
MRRRPWAPVNDQSQGLSPSRKGARFRARDSEARRWCVWGQEAGPAVAGVENESGDNARISRGRTAGGRVAINHQFISKFGNSLESF